MKQGLTLPSEDIRVALKRGILFKVSVRDAVTRKWLTVSDNVGLTEAAEQIGEVDVNKDRAIFVEMIAGGAFYWSSDRQPHSFNSQLIHDAHYLPQYQRDASTVSTTTPRAPYAATPAVSPEAAASQSAAYNPAPQLSTRPF